jgi:hypothetical protein
MLVVMSAATFPQLIWTVFAWSLLAEAARPAAASAAAEVTPGPDQSRALTLNRLAENLGITFGPALGGILAGIDFRLLFAVDALTCWLAAGLVVWLRRSSRRPTPAVAVGVPTSSPLFDGPFLLFLVFMAFLAMALFQLLGTYQLYLAEYGGFTPFHIGLLFAVNTLMIVTMEMPLMHSLRKVPRLILVGIGSCLLCAGFGILAFGDTLVLIGGSLLVWTVGEMLCLSPAMTFVSQRADSSNRGRYLGTYTAGISTAFVLAPQVGMRLYERSPRTLWLCMFALAPVLLLAFLLLERCIRDGQRVAERLESLPDAS